VCWLSDSAISVGGVKSGVWVGSRAGCGWGQERGVGGVKSGVWVGSRAGCGWVYSRRYTHPLHAREIVYYIMLYYVYYTPAAGAAGV
jgi:hypothetical protein